MYDVLPRSSETVLGIRIWGTCTETDIERLRHWLSDYAPQMGPVSLVVVFNQERCGVRLTTLWNRLADDIDTAHDVSRIALVGTAGRPLWYGQLARRLTDADVRCFQSEELNQAWDWANQGQPALTLLPVH